MILLRLLHNIGLTNLSNEHIELYTTLSKNNKLKNNKIRQLFTTPKRSRNLNIEKIMLIAIAIIIVNILGIGFYSAVFVEPDQISYMKLRNGTSDYCIVDPEESKSENITDFNFLEDPIGYEENSGSLMSQEEEFPKRKVTSLYKIKHGDSFMKIASVLYGDERRYVEIINANPGLDPSYLKIGQVIKLPEPIYIDTEPSKKETSKVKGVLDKKHKTHIVKEGETLISISNIYYGTSDKWRKIWKANQNLISSPNAMKVGLEIIIP